MTTIKNNILSKEHYTTKQQLRVRACPYKLNVRLCIALWQQLQLNVVYVMNCTVTFTAAQACLCSSLVVSHTDWYAC
jgi:hypothetical protein